MRVRASRPSFWVGQTYDTWNGQSWVESVPTGVPAQQKLPPGSPFDIPPESLFDIPLGSDQPFFHSSGTTDVQTFYLAQSGPNLVFHADAVQRVYIQSHSLFLPAGGAILSASSMGSGTIYTVVSNDDTATAAQLRSAAAPPPASPTDPFTQLPHPYPRVAALARQITGSIGSAGQSTPPTRRSKPSSNGCRRMSSTPPTSLRSLAALTPSPVSFSVAAADTASRSPVRRR